MSIAKLRPQARTPIRDGFTAFDMMAVTLEDGDFLYALVRVTKPRLVIECGTGKGISGTFIAEALRDNGQGGRLVSYEPDMMYAAEARVRLRELPATVIVSDSEEWDWEAEPPDLVYIDSHMGRRHDDIERWLTCGYDGLVLVHDAMRLYPELELGTGVLLKGADGLWLGRRKSL